MSDYQILKIFYNSMALNKFLNISTWTISSRTRIWTTNSVISRALITKAWNNTAHRVHVTWHITSQSLPDTVRHQHPRTRVRPGHQAIGVQLVAILRLCFKNQNEEQPWSPVSALSSIRQHCGTSCGRLCFAHLLFMKKSSSSRSPAAQLERNGSVCLPLSALRCCGWHGIPFRSDQAVRVHWGHLGLVGKILAPGLLLLEQPALSWCPPVWWSGEVNRAVCSYTVVMALHTSAFRLTPNVSMHRWLRSSQGKGGCNQVQTVCPVHKRIGKSPFHPQHEEELAMCALSPVPGWQETRTRLSP